MILNNITMEKICCIRHNKLKELMDKELVDKLTVNKETKLFTQGFIVNFWKYRYAKDIIDCFNCSSFVRDINGFQEKEKQSSKLEKEMCSDKSIEHKVQAIVGFCNKEHSWQI